MQVVVLDTNALLMPFEVRINLDLEIIRLLGECRILVPEPLLGELRRMNKPKSRAALSLAAKYETVPTKARGDNAVVELAQREDAYVVTNDRGLRRRLKDLGIKTIILRSSNHLVIA